MKSILCIDGGGMRGYIPCAFLAELERRAGKPCHEMFDMIWGTSIGGILACLLATGMPASDALRLFTQDGPIMFKRKLWRSFGLLAPRYPAGPIEQVLRTRLAGYKLSDARVKLGVPTLELYSQDPYMFKSYDPGADDECLYLWQIARATSAAQTYFPEFNIGKQAFWDGGNVANNPSVCAYADAVNLWPTEPRRVLSLGCGESRAAVKPGQLGTALRAAAATVSLLFEAGAEEVDYQMTSLLADKYVRVQPTPAFSLPLDDASVRGLTLLKQAADQNVRDNYRVIEKWLSPLN